MTLTLIQFLAIAIEVEDDCPRLFNPSRLTDCVFNHVKLKIIILCIVLKCNDNNID